MLLQFADPLCYHESMDESADTGNAAEKAIAKAYEKANNAWFRGALQAVPMVGGTLDTWFFQLADATKEQRVTDALNDLRARIERLEVDSQHIQDNVEEFAYITERGIFNIAQDYREAMRAAYVKMLAHFYSKEFSDLNNKELYLQYLDSLAPIHLVMLKHLHDNLGPGGILKSQPGEAPEDKIFELVGRGIDRTLVLSLVNDLVTRGMLTHVQHTAVDGDVHTYSFTGLGETMLRLVTD